MKMAFQLNLEQKQQLILTPELKQAIKLLQYSSIELNSYIQEELERNPVLEESDPEEGSQEDINQEEKSQSEEGESFDINWKEYFQDSSDIGRSLGQGPRSDEEHTSFEYFTSSTPTMYDHLSFQLSLLDLNDEDKVLVDFLLGNLDENGYLRGSICELANTFGCDLEALGSALAIIQEFEPKGIGARNLAECLELQIKTHPDPPERAVELVNNYLEHVANNRLDLIAKEMDLDIRTVQEKVDFIKTLNPKPASTLSIGSGTSFITPDVTIQETEGRYEVIVNDNLAPRLTISPVYKNLLMQEQTKSGITQFINSRLNSAMWLIKSIEQRRLTLYNIVENIVNFQRQFLDYGVSHLKPLTLKEIADAIGVHESTVSRATANKYVETPRGVFPLRYFFSSKVKSGGNDDYVSSTCIKEIVKELIAEEDKKQPLSDQKIAEILNNDNASLSRRTVAKYRKELDIPSSGKRKRY